MGIYFTLTLKTAYNKNTNVKIFLWFKIVWLLSFCLFTVIYWQCFAACILSLSFVIFYSNLKICLLNLFSWNYARLCPLALFFFQDSESSIKLSARHGKKKKTFEAPKSLEYDELMKLIHDSFPDIIFPEITYTDKGENIFCCNPYILWI